jgi:hypothetical protein
MVTTRKQRRRKKTLARISVVAVIAVVAAGLVWWATDRSSLLPSPPTTTVVPIAYCPLTGTPAPNNEIPQRPALAIKVDNYSLGPAPAEARPQSGLDHADIIFEEQVEGSITRYAAVFQCHNAPGLVGPVRSARWTDIQMLSQLGHPILVHVGGIAPVLRRIDASALINVDLGDYSQLDTYPPGRYAPYDTYTTTKQIWDFESKDHTPPRPIFTFSKTVPPGVKVRQIHLDWSYTSNIYWRWNPPTGTWQRYYNVATSGPPVIQPDVLADGVQNQAQNVIVQLVTIDYGPWLENSEGGLEARSLIIGHSGQAYIFRNGEVIACHWSDPTTPGPVVYKNSQGVVVPLQPGRTWVEIYPQSGSLSTVPTKALTETPTTL